MTLPIPLSLPGLSYAGAFNQPALFSGILKARGLDTHKGSFGTLHVVGGAPGMVGAVLLTARSALFSGAGRVLVYPLEKLSHDPLHPELMMRSTDIFNPAVHSEQSGHSAILCGPGLGKSELAQQMLQHSLNSTLPLVLDADALNLIAEHADLAQVLAKRAAPTVITPHPLEAARLLQCSAEKIQLDRAAAACQLARQFNAVAVLKGAGTVIAIAKNTVVADDAPTNKFDVDKTAWVINSTGNPALATAGSGDVLAGLLGTLLMQAPDSAFKAACAAVWLHGQAADDWVSKTGGTVGLGASELPPLIRYRLNGLISALN